MAEEKTSSQKFEEVTRLWSELEALIIFVTLPKTYKYKYKVHSKLKANLIINKLKLKLSIHYKFKSS